MDRTSSTIQIGFPMRLDRRGRLYDPSYDDHVQQMIELVLFTSPGERVNRPDFGCGLLEAIFGENDAPEASAVEYLVQTALQRWLADVISVEEVRVQAADSVLAIEVVYSLLTAASNDVRVAVFEAPRSW